MTTTNNLTPILLSASANGAVLGGAAFLVGHPFDVVKTNMQASLNARTNEIFRNIYRKKGFLGFYSGTLPGLSRAVGKQIYRWPLMVTLPQQYRRIFSSPFDKMATGITIANLEVLLLNPIEQAKMQGIINGDYSYLKKLYFTRRYSALFRGIIPTLYKQNVSWTTFLVLDDISKNAVRTFKKTDTLSTAELMATGTFVGVVNTAATMPFDFAKTQFQKDLFSPNRQGVMQTIFQGVKKGGLPLIYAGWKPRMMQYVLHAIFTVNVLENFRSQNAG